MALTSQQKTDIRRLMGYPLLGTLGGNDAYGDIGYTQMSLSERLVSLTADEEAVIINTYLTACLTLETAIPASSANLDTDIAAVWTHNKREVKDRMELFDNWRRRLCGFVGFRPGPGIASTVQPALVR